MPEPIWVLDASIIQQTWSPPDREVPVWQGITATLEPDGCTLTMFFPGGPAEWMQYPTAEVLESGGALALIPVEVITGPTRTGEGPWSCGLVGHAREVTVILARALGHRVLLDQVGSPVMVSPAGDPARPAPASC